MPETTYVHYIFYHCVVVIGPCRDDQFTCSNGRMCVPMETRCDGDTNCFDESDEHMCGK